MQVKREVFVRVTKGGGGKKMVVTPQSRGSGT